MRCLTGVACFALAFAAGAACSSFDEGSGETVPAADGGPEAGETVWLDLDR